MPDQTTRFGIPFPLPEDALVDYPALGSALASKLEALLVGAVQRSIYWQAGSATYVTPTGAIALLVELVSGGGAGGGAAATTAGQWACGGGGGGAGFGAALILNPAASYPYTVGAGGAPGAAAANGGSGQSSIFGAASVNGGGGGVGATTPQTSPYYGAIGGGPGGGTVAGLDYSIWGQDGGRGVALTTAIPLGADGGNAARGGGGASGVFTSGGSGNAGRPPGGGGGGASNTASQVARAGAAGAAGLIVVEAIFPRSGAIVELAELEPPADDLHLDPDYLAFVAEQEAASEAWHEAYLAELAAREPEPIG